MGAFFLSGTLCDTLTAWHFFSKKMARVAVHSTTTPFFVRVDTITDAYRYP